MRVGHFVLAIMLSKGCGSISGMRGEDPPFLFSGVAIVCWEGGVRFIKPFAHERNFLS